jgi:polyferredoxin
MDKVGRPRGLIRYASLEELQGKPAKALYKRARVWIYGSILLVAWSGIIFGLTSMDAIQLKVLHERQPLFVLQSDGSIQNKYTLKILNKLTEDLALEITATGPEPLELIGADDPVTVEHGGVTRAVVFARVPRKYLEAETQPIVFQVAGTNGEGELISSDRASMFIGPRPSSIPYASGRAVPHSSPVCC